MKFSEGVSKWMSRLFKTTIYGLALTIVIITIYSFVSSDLVVNIEKCEAETGIHQNKNITALKNTQALVACLETKNWFLENWQIRDTIKTIQTLPNAPCKYVGVWESVQPQCRYTVTLKANSEFTATPIACNISMSSYSGTWGVSESKMVWLDSRKFKWPIDINPIEDDNNNSFILVERNGSRTKFTRLENSSLTTGCARPATVSTAEIAAAPTVAQATIASAPVVVAQAAVATAAAPSPAATNDPLKSVADQAMPPVAATKTDHIINKAQYQRRRKPSDLRYCLELSSNYEIAKCASAQK